MVLIPENERTKHIWDLDENHNFIKINNYKVVNRKGYKDASNMLRRIDNYIVTLKKMASNRNSNCYINNFISVPYIVQEIPENDVFEGINKPKHIQYTKYSRGFPRDDEYITGYRLIMLKIRRKNGKLRAWNSIKKLLLHELAHTMCNHCTYREEGNHQDDFKKSEEFLTTLANQLHDRY